MMRSAGFTLRDTVLPAGRQLQEKIRPTGRRLQEWTNRNVFATSIDSWNSVPDQAQFATTCVDELEAVDEQQAENVPTPKTKNDQITALQAAWNVTNAIQGMFIVGLPIAVKVGGWWTVFAIFGVAYLCYSTGILLIECLYENGHKVRYSYKDVAEAYRPGMGRFVLMAQMTELLSTCIIYLVIAGDLLESSMPSVDKAAWMMLVTAILLGCAFLDSLRIVSDLSLANAISHLIINAIMLFYCLTEVSNWVWGDVPITLSIRTMPTVIGVVVFGYTSHIFLPSLEASMKNPSEFEWMLRWSHIVAAVFKAVFGLLGFLTFGELTQKEISNSLPNQFFKILINVVLVIKALFSYPLPYYAAVQLLTENLFSGTKSTLFTSCYGSDRTLREWALGLRLILILLTLFMALTVPYLIELMGLIGNITGTMLSFIWPALFHLRIKGATLSARQCRFDRFIIILGLLIMIIGIYFSALELADAVKNDGTKEEL